ncbi:MAG: hypothetical protein KDD94_08845 [Calditrichaeota bacterium]|nr:hypothetical protein [Calditrichota bacterium]
MIKSTQFKLFIALLVLFISACDNDDENSKYDGTWYAADQSGYITISDNATKISITMYLQSKNKGISAPQISGGPFSMTFQGNYSSESFEKYNIPNSIIENYGQALPIYVLAKIDGPYLVIRGSDQSYDDAFTDSDFMFMKQ